ncbi:MAG: ribonuclease HII [Saprospiraceae bacterium]|nr:ribonuclease HII [Saprospiraceae bacterium]
MPLLPYLHAHLFEAGCDEAGRGCLAGPVFAAAVVLPPDFYHPLLNDSKQLTEKQRKILREVVEKEAVCWAVARVEPEEIDRINILKASFLAMHRALDQLTRSPEFILVDGNRFVAYKEVPHACIIKGDGKYTSIAAASILAKTWRDAYMDDLHTQYPQYDWLSNKGYPTLAHREAIRQYGITPFHRHSFQLLPANEQLQLF